jgi:hypothetical protein
MVTRDYLNTDGTASTCYILLEVDTTSLQDALDGAARVLAEHARQLAQSEEIQRFLDDCENEEFRELPRDHPYTAVAPPATPEPRRLNHDRCPLHCSPTLRHDPGRHPRPPPVRLA